MKSARNTLPTEPVNGLTCGIDWARDDHALSIVNAKGRETTRKAISHDAAGLRDLITMLDQAGAREVAIERPDGPVVAALLEAGITVVVISPSIAEQLSTHADAHIFTSLPRSGTFRAARLLAEIGDCRARFPTPESLACLAGVAPSTRQSGKVKHVGFRWAADKQLRDAVCNFAGDSRRANPWAADLYNRARARGHDHPHAVRILARAWLYIIWHCWQDRTTYDPAQHRALQHLLNRPQPGAA